MEYPSEVLEIVKAAVKRHKTTSGAVREAEKKIRALPTFEAIAEIAIHHAIRELVGDVRHTDNRQMRKAAGEYGPLAKTVTGTSPEILAIADEALLDYHIAGTVLGLVKGEELEADPLIIVTTQPIHENVKKMMRKYKETGTRSIHTVQQGEPDEVRESISGVFQEVAEQFLRRVALGERRTPFRRGFFPRHT